MVKDKASKKDVDVKEVKAAPKAAVVKEAPKATYYDKVISRRGKNVTIRTYSDGKKEEL
jgi:phage antirepressor YoqD-like protein